MHQRLPSGVSTGHRRGHEGCGQVRGSLQGRLRLRSLPRGSQALWSLAHGRLREQQSGGWVAWGWGRGEAEKGRQRQGFVWRLRVRPLGHMFRGQAFFWRLCVGQGGLAFRGQALFWRLCVCQGRLGFCGWLRWVTGRG